jgi:hypothetical protein
VTQAQVVPDTPEGPEGIRKLGHRDYVGGLWNEIGLLQFGYLVTQGLRPRHVLLDIGCGCLRGGRHFVEYLAPGNYVGLDKEPALLKAAVEHELPKQVRERKKPTLLVSDDFDFSRLRSRRITRSRSRYLRIWRPRTSGFASTTSETSRRSTACSTRRSSRSRGRSTIRRCRIRG